MRRSIVLGLLMVVGALSLVVSGAQAPAQQGPKTIDIQKLKDNLYVLLSNTAGSPSFSGGTTAVYITDSGVVLVDTKLAGWGQAVLDRVKSVTSKPVTMIINTHTHGDHTGNDGFFGNVEIVAHENTKANMEKMDAFKGDNAKFLPKKTFKDKTSVLTGKDRLDLYYFGPGHTNGDAIIVWPALRIAHTGDLFAGKNPPRIDPGNGGSGVAYPETLSKLVAGISNVDTVITGHNPVSTWQDLQEYARFNQDFVTAVRSSMKAGKSVDETAAMISTTLNDKYRSYGLQDASRERVKEDVAIIYKELQK